MNLLSNAIKFTEQALFRCAAALMGPGYPWLSRTRESEYRPIKSRPSSSRSGNSTPD